MPSELGAATLLPPIAVNEFDPCTFVEPTVDALGVGVPHAGQVMDTITALAAPLPPNETVCAPGEVPTVLYCER